MADSDRITVETIHPFHGGQVWFFDFPTLVLVIAAGLQAGLQAVFGIDAATAIFGPHAKTILMLMGVSAVWQLLRQRFH